MDGEAVKQLVTSGGSMGIIAWIAFYMVREVLKIGDKHLTAQANNQMKIIENHEKERTAWMITLQKFNDTIDRAASFQREEHTKMIQILEGLERSASR